MRIVTSYSQLNGLEFLLVHRPHLWKEIKLAIAAVDAGECRTKVSAEKTMRGKVLYAPKEMNRRMKDRFKNMSWEERRTGYWVTEDARLIRKDDAHVSR